MSQIQDSGPKIRTTKGSGQSRDLWYEKGSVYRATCWSKNEENFILVATLFTFLEQNGQYTIFPLTRISSGTFF